MAIRCEIVTQERVVFADDVDIVILLGADGEMGILPNHSPVLTTVQYGVITVRLKGREERFAVAGGVAEVQPDQVTILADDADNVMDIDIQKVESARKDAEEALSRGTGSDDDALLNLRSTINRANLFINAARRYRQGRSQRF